MKNTVGSHVGDTRERLVALAETRGVSLASLSRLIGRNGTYLQQFITKGSPRRLAEDDRRTLAQFFGVGEEELGAAARGVSSASGTKARKWVDIPRLPLGASAGPGAISGDEVPFDSLQFSDNWLKEHGFDHTMLSIISVTGDSMEPELRDGDEILVDRAPRAFRDGIHVIRLGEAVHVKRVQALRPGRLSIISSNPSYPAIEVSAQEVELIGRVVWKGGRL